MYRIEKMPNGLTVVVAEMPARDSVAVGIWVKVGARYEQLRISGIAHFTEHLLFKGTKTRSARKIKESIEGLGGVFNAFTGEESTCYFVKILKDHFELTFDVLADMIKNSLFRAQDIERERTVILEEIKMYQDLPQQFVQERMNQLLWPDQSLGRNVAGTLETVSGIKHADFLDFNRKFYHPSNLLVTVCGDVPAEHVIEQAQKHFSGNRAGQPSRFSPANSSQNRPRFDFFTKETEQTHVVIGFHGPARTNTEKFKIALLNIILGGNMSSRLFEEVREKRGLSYEIKSSLYFFQDAGGFTVSEGVEKKKLPLSIRVILNELRKIRNKPVGEQELRRAKDYYLGQLYLALEDTLDQMVWLGEKVMYLGEPPTREEIREKIEAVTARDIQAIAGRYLRTNNLNLAVVGPTPKDVQKQIKDDFYIE